MNPSSRSSAKLANLTKHPFLVAYFTIGYPSPQLFLEYCQAIVDSGADLLELGIPSKLGILDGPWIKLSYLKARESCIDLEGALELASEIKHPKVILSYYQDLGDLDRGFKFVKNSDALGLLIPDLGFLGLKALEVYSELSERYGLAKVFFIQESFPEPIIHGMLKLKPDMIYLGISYTTGWRYNRYYSNPLSKLRWLSKIADQVPIAVGFGIQSPDQIQELMDAGARGIVIGSILVKLIEVGGYLGFVAKLKISELVRELKGKLKLFDDKNSKNQASLIIL